MKALAVFSGGLDSMLAAAWVRSLGIAVQAVFFESPFFTSARAQRSARVLDLPFKVFPITTSLLEILKNPKHGFGGNMNPCIDCHALMIRRAGELLAAEEADFIITGEVLGQRPMSQNKQALRVVAAESGFGERVLRPLSAKLLPPTLPEEKGWIKKEDLLDIQGRSRKPQMALAQKMGIQDYPAPAGGCLLTDPIFALRLRDLFSSKSEFALYEIELLKSGRHFRLGPAVKLIVGRNKADNQAIEALAGVQDLMIKTVSVPGPTALMIGAATPAMEETAARITAAYSDLQAGQETAMRLTRSGDEQLILIPAGAKEIFRNLLLQ
ncbi:MAG: tRNA 4-thiouridine(8) synthase ThiI [Desulfobacteraceae bacterium]|nr:MAG: tRNA 4-thiouridine(8) synthase ThiI [Desulfobacteraceae bacterium]